MAEALRILVAEDSETDAELVQRELKRGGLDFQSRRVQTEPDFRRELDEFRPDLVISDFSMPHFSGPRALAIARESRADIPFIFISGTIGENVAVDMMKAGADDYVMKNNLTRLVPALKRELREAEVRRARRIAEERLHESEAALRRAQVLAKIAHIVTRPDGSFERWSETLPQLLGVEPEQLPRSTREWMDLLHPDDRDGFRATAIEAALAGTRKDVEYRLRRTDGGWSQIRQVIEPLRSHADAEGGTRWFSTLQDVTEHRLAEEKIHHLNRVFAVLSGINALIVRVRDRDELFQGVCRIAIEAGKFPMAWVGVADPETQRVKPVAWGGEAEKFLASAPLSISQNRAGRGMSGTAVKEKKAVIVNDLQNDPRAQMKEHCRERGISSLVMLPLVVQGEGMGVLALYAREVGFFDDEEMKLLLELSGDISFALDHIAKAEKLDYLAYYDSLTGLANRSLFHERLVQYVSAAQAGKSRLAVAVVDVDRFKIINDSLGRQAGDELLRLVAERIEGHAGPIRMARINADRFAIVRTGVSSDSEVARLIEQWLAECFGPPYAVSGTELRVSAKAGIALFPNDGTDADSLFQNAEAALKKAKTTGERYLFHTQQMTERIGEKLALENKLRQALEKEEFVLHYQPIVDTSTRRIESVEALIRWQSPELGLVPPIQFIPLLEETGLILEVGAWALRRAVLDHRNWKDRGLSAPRISVNVSPIQLRKRDFVTTVDEALKFGARPPGIDLEITESLVMEDIEANTKKLEAVRVLGVSIAIDDFGTGYSSLGYLAKLPAHSLKIDRSFIITMLHDPNVMTLVSTIVSLAHSLHLKVVAEGVDAEEQAEALKRLGCHEMQGYLISKPVPFDEMTALLVSGEGKGKA